MISDIFKEEGKGNILLSSILPTQNLRSVFVKLHSRVMFHANLINSFFSTVCQVFSRSFLLMLNLWPNTPKLSFHTIVSATYCNLFNTKSYVYDWMHQESSFAISIFTQNFMRLKLKINYAFFHYDISQPGIPAFYCFSYTFITLIQQH